MVLRLCARETGGLDKDASENLGARWGVDGSRQLTERLWRHLARIYVQLSSPRSCNARIQRILEISFSLIDVEPLMMRVRLFTARNNSHRNNSHSITSSN